MTRRDLWKAPAENGGLLIDPPIDRVPELLETNRKRLEQSGCRILGKPLCEVRGHIRNSTHFLNVPTIITGHQPQLYHPGVWIKQFAIRGLARRFGIGSASITIESDTIKSTSLQLPVWDSSAQRVMSVGVPFDDWTGEEPIAGRRIRNLQRFLEFPDTARSIWIHWPFSPLLPQVWQELTSKGATERPASFVADLAIENPRPARIGSCFLEARLILERRWGCKNAQTPMWDRWYNGAFAAHVVRDLQRFHSVHNECVRAYRRKYGLRSANHPVPELAIDGEYLEAPFWWYDVKNNQRQRLFVRAQGDRYDFRPGVSGSPIRVWWEGEDTFSSGWNAPGLWIYPRALTTTMILRLFIADLFIHGIGGAKYDEVTDDIIRRYFGIEPPEYMVVSGTLRLPFKTFPSTADDRKRLARRLRDLEWQPERFVSGGDTEAADLVAEKNRLRAQEPLTKAARRERFRKLQEINAKLHAKVPPELAAESRRALERCDQELSANEILQRRDYAFVLHPEETLKPFCTQLLEI